MSKRSPESCYTYRRLKIDVIMFNIGDLVRYNKVLHSMYCKELLAPVMIVIGRYHNEYADTNNYACLIGSIVEYFPEYTLELVQ